MSESIRQSNLFSGESYKKVFKAYQFIDYTAYDFDTLKQALLNYIQTYYPEDFNDYIESSEFIAIVELLSYFGTSLAFRTDLNSRENFIDTAERRESIIRLAQMVNYVPRRNIPANGLLKIAAVQTNQPLTDASGININDVSVYWNDPNNPDWFDQFVQICNAGFSSLNPFGRPTKSGTIGNIPTDLYQLNNILRLNVTYSTNITVNGEDYPIDICNPDFITNQTIFERDPDPINAFNFIYRNDSLGVSSANTGFFLYFKQGSLINIDTNFDFPVPNRLFPVDTQNINQDDVYVQETDQIGNVINKWVKVPALAGENIIYNSIQNNQRNIFDVITGANDTITIRFADGNFGNVPTGLFRTWVRTSANQPLVIRPNDAQGLQINIPYIGVDQQQYTLRIIFNLEQTIGNAAPTETNEQIKLRAPEVFSTQSRMVNGSDYNVLPLVYGNQIAKIQAINRTYSGQSRYIDLNDPTGFHRDLLIFGQDGALYRDNQNVLVEVVKNASTLGGTIESILTNSIQEILRDSRVSKFFYDEYLSQFESTVRVDSPGTGRSLLNLVPNSTDPSLPLYWGTSPVKFKNTTGYFASTQSSTSANATPLINTLNSANIPNSVYQAWGFIKDGSVIEFITPAGNIVSTTVNTVIQNGNPIFINPLTPYANIGPVELGSEIQNGSQVTKVYPPFRNTLTTSEIYGNLSAGIYGIVPRIKDGISFWLYYDLLQDTWNTSTVMTPSISDQTQQPFIYAPVNPGSIYSNWENYPASGLLYINITQDSVLGTTTYDLTARGRTYVFESYRDVRFYWEPGQVVIDSATNQALRDTIEIMPFVNTNSTIDNNIPIMPAPPATPYIELPTEFNISGVYIQADGYLDPAKVQVSLTDANNDGIPDNPEGFNNIVSAADRIVFEYYNNEVSGYQSTRPWIARWGNDLASWPGNVYVYFPVDLTDNSKIYGSPFISNMIVVDQYDPENSTPTAIILYMDRYDLIFLNNDAQLTSIANQVSAFFNNTDYTITQGINTLGSTVSGSGYTPNIYENVPLTGGTGTGATANITFTISSDVTFLGAIATLGTLTTGGSYLPNIYENVPLTGGTGTGARATININGAGSVGAVINNPAIIITDPGTGYTAGDHLSASDADLGAAGGSGFDIVVDSVTSAAVSSGPIVTFGVIAATVGPGWTGLNYLPGTYTSVPLVGGHGTGATANIIVNGATNVTTVALVSAGTGYIVGDELSALPSTLGIPSNPSGSGLRAGGFIVPVLTITAGPISNSAVAEIVNSGAGYIVGNVLSASNANLGGVGSGFSSVVTSAITSQITTSVDTVSNKIDIVTNNFINKSFLIDPATNVAGYGVYKSLQFGSTADYSQYYTGQILVSQPDVYHFDKNGKVFTQNTTISQTQQLPFYFKWSHYSPIDQRVDPSPSNIVDMIVITNSYLQDILIWKNSNNTAANLPLPPTTEELRIQFQSLDQYKMVSDSMIWNSGVFKILFGTQAAPELQATFKVVKAASSNISDNEIKTRVIQAIDIYFDVRNWDFGEKFFYTELAAFIHQQLSRVISSVVIVPNTANSQFGNLFEIIASPNELFMSTATVNNVQVVVNLTDQNLRV